MVNDSDGVFFRKRTIFIATAFIFPDIDGIYNDLILNIYRDYIHYILLRRREVIRLDVLVYCACVDF